MSEPRDKAFIALRGCSDAPTRKRIGTSPRSTWRECGPNPKVGKSPVCTLKASKLMSWRITPRSWASEQSAANPKVLKVWCWYCWTLSVILPRTTSTR